MSSFERGILIPEERNIECPVHKKIYESFDIPNQRFLCYLCDTTSSDVISLRARDNVFKGAMETKMKRIEEKKTETDKKIQQLEK